MFPNNIRIFSVLLLLITSGVYLQISACEQPEQLTASTEKPHHQIQIAIYNQQLRIQNGEGLQMELYNITGSKIMSCYLNSNDYTYILSELRGIYIVKVGKVVRRITI